MSINTKELRVFPETLPTDFVKAVSMLRRPYQKINSSEYRRLLAMLDSKYDLFIYQEDNTSHLVTIGNADGGYAIMPLSAQDEEFYFSLRAS